MRKEKTPLVSIQSKTAQPATAWQHAVLFLCRFILYASASLGFLLSFLLILSKPWDAEAFAPWLLVFSLFFTIVQSIPKPKYQRMLLPGFCILGVFLLCLKRENFLLETRAFLGNLNHILEDGYGISLFPSYVLKGDDYHLFLPAATGVFLLLFYLAATGKKTFFLLLLLLLPPSLDFFLNVSPTFVSLGCFLTAFLFWNVLKQNQSPGFSALAVPCCTLFLYFLCAQILVPTVSQHLFQWRKPLYTKVNELCTALFEPSSASDTSAPSRTKEQVRSRESLSNTAPVHNNETMFYFSSDSRPSESIYLRGFVGKTYTGSQWKSCEDQLLEDFLRSNKRDSQDNISLLHNIPFNAIKKQNNSLYEMTLSPAFSASYSYLPWGVQIPDNLETGESNELKKPFSKSVSFSGIPLALSDAAILESPGLSSRKAATEKLYHSYVTKQYLEVPKNKLSTLSEEIQKLPVFQSMPKQPSVSQIQDAAREIQTFLWEHASYSLALEPLPFGNEFVEDFLFRQHQGFCIHFATAGTLLFRMYGIPARYVSGYVIHPQDLHATGSYTSQITDASAHAWTEIYVGKGGWIPVEVTPSAADTTASIPQNQEENSQNQAQPPKPVEKEPEVSPETPGKNPEKGDAAPSQKEESKGQKTPSIVTAFLSILRLLLLLFVAVTLFFAALLLWRTLCFRKHLGYFAVSSYDCFQTVFRSLLKLWERLYDFSSKGLSDQELFRIFTEKLPEKEQKIFLEFYQMAEGFTFGQAKPERKQLRDLRTVYGIYRKKLLKNSSPFRRFYICYILGW